MGLKAGFFWMRACMLCLSMRIHLNSSNCKFINFMKHCFVARLLDFIELKCACQWVCQINWKLSLCSVCNI